jgi:hypothetical protein
MGLGMGGFPAASSIMSIVKTKGTANTASNKSNIDTTTETIDLLTLLTDVRRKDEEGVLSLRSASTWGQRCVDKVMCVLSSASHLSPGNGYMMSSKTQNSFA